MAESVLEVTDQSFDKEVLQSGQPVLVDFWAEWCGPCRMLAPTVEAVAKEYAGRVKVAKVNVDENGATAARYRIQGIPTLLVFKGGQVQGQLVGVQSKGALTSLLDKQL